jgi:hypothetical protein
MQGVLDPLQKDEGPSGQEANQQRLFQTNVSNGMDSSSPNRHLCAKMVSEQSTIVKMRRSPNEHYPRRS